MPPFFPLFARRPVLVPAAAVIAWLIGLGEPVRARPVDLSAISSNRIVHRFDFDERPSGNMEDIPKYWEPLRPPGFPHYAYARFDFQVGGLAPPSFHLVSEGRNVAFSYSGPDTRVRANTDYQIVAYIRGDHLEYARACFSAHFLDSSGLPILDTLVRSRYVGGPGDRDEWTRVELSLGAAPPQADRIGLVAWVLQGPIWRAALPPRHYIPRNDVHGGAWFDDITIYALPRVRLATSAPANVMSSDGPQELYVTLADDDDPTLQGRVSINSADGTLVASHPISVVMDVRAEPVRVALDHLSPGIYTAQLDVISGENVIRSRTLTFAILAPRQRASGSISRSFGVVVDPRTRSEPMTELALLASQAVHSLKLPVWSGLADDMHTLEQERAMDRLLQELAEGGFALTGVFLGPPAAIVRSDGAYQRPLLELLSSDSTVWNEHLAAAVAPYASVFRWWEIGPHRAAPRPPADQLARAVAQVREAMRPFITIPRLAMPVSATVEPAPKKLPVEQVTLAMGNAIQPESFASLVARSKSLGYEYVSVYVEPLESGKYRRFHWLADWARRIIMARHAGADTVFVPQTWTVRQTAGGRITEPKEEYLVLRTIADVLADATPGPTILVDGAVRCLAFHDGESSILVLWDPQAPPEGKRYPIQMGQADRQVDIWGRSKLLERDEQGRQVIRLSPLPLFVPGVQRWLVDFRSSLSLKPAAVESGTERGRHSVEIAYPGDRPVSGRMEFDMPEAWTISPRAFSFTLTPNRAGGYPIEMRYPHNESAGQKEIRAKIVLAGASTYLEVPLFVDVGVADLEVSGLAVIEGNELVLRHVVTNRSSNVMSFRGSATVPGRQRQYRPISNLQPGDTQTVQYRFGDGNGLIGRSIRLVLREVNDGPRIHNLELIVP